MSLILSAVLLLLSLALIGEEACVGVLFVSQVILLVGEIRKGQVSGVGGFIFMSFLFFGMRPLHLLYEQDFDLWTSLFLISVDLDEWTMGMWWGTCGIWFFAFGAELVSRRYKMPSETLDRTLINSIPIYPRIALATDRNASILLLYQIVSLGLMYRLSGGGRGLYGSALGAYAYDLPIPLQSGHIFALMVILELHLANPRSGHSVKLAISVCLFLLFTWLMREVSMFRGFYIAGVMIAGIAVLSRIKRKVSLYWLILPIVLLQPLFRALGENRYSDNSGLKEQGIVAEAFSKEGMGSSYWRFYDSSGDMNIFDTFVAARAAQPLFRPYIYSWLYAPMHIVPRSVWKSKPEQGILQDVTFMNGAPYAPGIAGFFVLDGGDFWMLGCMTLLGYLIGLADQRALKLPDGYLRCCMIAILSVNAMFLTRFYLWQYFYQVLYAVAPCFALARLFPNPREAGAGANESGPRGGSQPRQ